MLQEIKYKLTNRVLTPTNLHYVTKPKKVMTNKPFYTTRWQYIWQDKICHQQAYYNISRCTLMLTTEIWVSLHACGWFAAKENFSEAIFICSEDICFLF